MVLSPELSRRVGRVENGIRGLSSSEFGLEGVSRLLLRSEAIASSRIEGIAPAPAQIAIAELAESDSTRGFSEAAALVANNIAVLADAGGRIARAEHVTVDDVVGLHDRLLPESGHTGLRTVQNWIGGSDWNPLDAEFVPPPADLVPGLMDDLVEYVNGAAHGPLVQAALVHAQFETIHPFADGNGRVGRALIHAVLRRRGVLPGAVLPVSMVLHTWSQRYVDGLTRFRPDPGAESGAAEPWIEVFAAACEAAVEQAERISEEIVELRQEWARRVAAGRVAAGHRPEPRSDSVDTAILRGLTEHPVLTVRLASQVYGASAPAARRALESLTDAGVLHKRSVGRRVTGYLARDVLDLVVVAERRLSSTRFDTRTAPPSGFAVPSSPDDW